MEKSRTSCRDGDVGEHSLSPHTTIAKNTTRLQNKFHPELSDNRAMWNPTSRDLKNPHLPRWVGGAELGMGGVVPPPRVVDKIWEGLPWERQIPAPVQTAEARVPALGR